MDTPQDPNAASLKAAAGSDPAPTADHSEQIEGLKQQVSKELGVYKGEIEQLKQSNQQLAEILAETRQAKAHTAEKKQAASESKQLKDLWYEDEEAAAALIEKRAETRIMKKVAAQRAEEQAKSNMLNALYAEYPELGDINSELTKEAIVNYERMSESQKGSEQSYKIAVRDAAAHLGVLPKDKRDAAGNESFTLGSGTSYMPKTNSRKTSLDPRTVEFARQVGLDVSKDGVMDALEKTAGRDNWTKYK